MARDRDVSVPETPTLCEPTSVPIDGGLDEDQPFAFVPRGAFSKRQNWNAASTVGGARAEVVIDISFEALRKRNTYEGWYQFLCFSECWL